MSCVVLSGSSGKQEFAQEESPVVVCPLSIRLSWYAQAIPGSSSGAVNVKKKHMKTRSDSWFKH
eukprot:2395194-Amphidinium_carterae.1